MRRFAVFVLCAALALAAYLYVPLPERRVPPAQAGDCVLLHLWTNGFHTDLGMPAEALPASHPLRRLFPQAQSLLIGWGEQSFYYSDGRNLWLAARAMFPSNATVMHVVEGADTGVAYLGPTEDATVAVSREGAQHLADYLRDALALDDQGRAIINTHGKVIGASYFLRARGNFNLFYVCNHWMARALRAAGLDINWRDKWLGGPLVEAAHRAAPSACPAGAPT